MSSTPEFDLFRLVILRNGTREALFETSPTGLRLTEFTISRSVRQVKELTEAIADRLGVHAFCLFFLSGQEISGVKYSLAVLETCGAVDTTASGLAWLDAASVETSEYEDPTI